MDREIEVTNIERDAWLRALNMIRIPNAALASVIKAQDMMLGGRDWFEVITAPGIALPMQKQTLTLPMTEVRSIAVIAELAQNGQDGRHVLEGALALPLERLRLRLQSVMEEAGHAPA